MCACVCVCVYGEGGCGVGGKSKSLLQSKKRLLFMTVYSVRANRKPLF